jgi:hypothetical protein
LIDFSKERALRCRADVDADRREPVEPVVLESALETARVTADLLHTLGVLAALPAQGATLSGSVVLPKSNHPSLDALSAKVVLLGTDFSTLTAADGSFVFRHLPEGDYQWMALAPGASSVAAPLSIRGAECILPKPARLEGAAGNLLRNSDFRLRWTAPDAPDHWAVRTPPGKLSGKTRVRDWDGEWLPLESGVSYQLEAVWKAAAAQTEEPVVFVRLKPSVTGAPVPTESQPLNPTTAAIVITGTPEAAWAQVCVRSAQQPAEILEAVRFLRKN